MNTTTPAPPAPQPAPIPFHRPDIVEADLEAVGLTRDVERRITPRTRALMPVHSAGVADCDRVIAAVRQGLAAQAV